MAKVTTYMGIGFALARVVRASSDIECGIIGWNDVTVIYGHDTISMLWACRTVRS